VSVAKTMKLNFKAGFAVLLGLITAMLVFDLTDWTYNLFRDPFDLWKMFVRLAVPVAATLFWLAILQMKFKPKGK
jgi:hypothetical protein